MEIVGKYAAYGWAVVHMDQDGEMAGEMTTCWSSWRCREPPRGEIQALLTVLPKLTGQAENHSDCRGVLQALNKGEVECICTNHNDADLGIQVWNQN